MVFTKKPLKNRVGRADGIYTIFGPTIYTILRSTWKSMINYVFLLNMYDLYIYWYIQVCTYLLVYVYDLCDTYIYLYSL